MYIIDFASYHEVVSMTLAPSLQHPNFSAFPQSFAGEFETNLPCHHLIDSNSYKFVSDHSFINVAIKMNAKTICEQFWFETFDELFDER